MNIVEATVHNLQSAKAVFLAIKQSNPEIKWLHVSKDAYAKIKEELTEVTSHPKWFQMSCLGFRFEDQDGKLHKVPVTHRLYWLTDHYRDMVKGKKHP